QHGLLAQRQGQGRLVLLLEGGQGVGDGVDTQAAAPRAQVLKSSTEAGGATTTTGRPRAWARQWASTRWKAAPASGMAQPLSRSSATAAAHAGQSSRPIRLSDPAAHTR